MPPGELGQRLLSFSGATSPGLRYYQQEAIEQLKITWQKHRAAIVVLATGLGKTRMFAEVAATWDGYGDVLILAHRKELLSQAAAAIEARTGVAAQLDQAENRAGPGRYVVASIDTIRRESRMQRHHRNRFGLIIIDEAHHYTAKEYRKPFEYFLGAKLLGVTATPDRGDRKALGRVFDRCAYRMDILDGIDAGFLVPIEARTVVTDMDMDDLSVSAGDLPAGALDEKVTRVCEVVIADLQRFLPPGGEQVLAFFPGVRSATYACELWNVARPGTAEVISAGTDPDERARSLADFRGGRLQMLTNCAVLTEGVDLPATSVVAIARPTLSRGLYTQMVGRGTRPNGAGDLSANREGAEQRKAAIAASVKPRMTILDYVGTGGRHALVGPADVLGGRYTDDEKRFAAKHLQGRDTTIPISQALEEARAHLRKAAERAQPSKAKSSHLAFDPFQTLHMDRPSAPHSDGAVPATARQCATLYKFGLKRDAVEGLTRKSANALLDSLFARSKRGLATYPQLAVLRRAGIHDVNLTRQQASQLLDVISRNGWKLPPGHPLQAASK